jgi:hypothetical protein
MTCEVLPKQIVEMGQTDERNHQRTGSCRELSNDFAGLGRLHASVNGRRSN